MIEIIKNNAKISYLMLPMYYVDGLLESQLLNLSYQTNQNFEIIILDPHYQKRKDNIANIINCLDCNVLYSPYYCNNIIPKQYDYSMWNTAALLSNTKHITLFQDYRYCHGELTDFIINNLEEYIKIDWQICHGIDQESQIGTQFVDIDKNDIKNMSKFGYFPKNLNIKKIQTILNNWGHYFISKKLWIELNGIDEHITSLHHYADLDLNARLTNYYIKKNLNKHSTTLQNAMIKQAHKRNTSSSQDTTKFRNGFCTNAFDIPLKSPCNNCKELHKYGDINYFDYVIGLVNMKKYTLLYREPLSEQFKTKMNPNLDQKNDFIIVQCNECFTTSESQFWWIRTNNDRIKSSIGIGIGHNKLGRNLSKIETDLVNKSTLEKIDILKNSWSQMEYLSE